MAMIRRWLALTYHLYALRLAALSHFYFNPLYWDKNSVKITNLPGFGKLFSCSGASMPKSRKWCLPDKTCRLLFECGKSSLHVPNAA